MRWQYLVLAAACGGAPKPPPPKPPEPAPVAKRVPIEDTEPEDGVTFVNARGHMEQAAIEAGLAPHTQALSDCYTTKVGKRKWLGGRVQLHWDISKAGDITSVKLAESDLGSHDIEKCLLDIAKAATFDKPVGGDADFALPLEFTMKGKVDVWDEDKSLRAVGGQLAKLDACKGSVESVVVTVYVGPRGAAQSVGFSSDKSEIADKWAECAVKAAMAWRLPDPKGQVAKLAIRYRP
jgi:hypothetical protein